MALLERRWAWLAGSVALGIVGFVGNACSGGDSGGGNAVDGGGDATTASDGSPVCTPGAQLACACPGGASGVQGCSSSGDTLEPCQCGTMSFDAGDSGSPSDAGAMADVDAATCNPGEQRCNGVVPQVCDGTGHWLNQPACSTYCLGGNCVACAPGATQCSNNAVETCSDAGAWTQQSACGGGTPYCIDAGCVACLAGQSQCGTIDGSSVIETCTSNHWQASASCAGGCAAGADGGPACQCTFASAVLLDAGAVTDSGNPCCFYFQSECGLPSTTQLYPPMCNLGQDDCVHVCTGPASGFKECNVVQCDDAGHYFGSDAAITVSCSMCNGVFCPAP